MKEILIRYKSFLAVIGTLSLVALLVYFAILPAWRQNRDLLNVIQATDADQEILRQQSGRLVSLQDQSEMIQGHRDAFRVKVSKSDPLGWVESIEGLARESGLAVKIDPIDIGVSKRGSTAKKPAATEDDAKSSSTDKSGSAQEEGKQKADEKPILETLPSDQYVSVRLTLDGDYPSIRFFLEKLELMYFYVDIVSVRISYMEPENKESQPSRESVFMTPISSDSGSGSSASNETSSGDDSTKKGSVQAVLDAVIYTE